MTLVSINQIFKVITLVEMYGFIFIPQSSSTWEVTSLFLFRGYVKARCVRYEMLKNYYV